jgi:hypothetical protein
MNIGLLANGKYRTNGANVGMDGNSYCTEDIRTEYLTVL